nr:DMT family transporter [Leucobacter exalbidus]
MRVWAALVGSGLAGVLVALQSRINGGLSQHLGNGFVTAAASFASGLLILSILMVCSRRGRRGLTLLKAEVKSKRLPVWALFGGAGGALFVLNQGLVAPITGLALFTVGIVAGQVLGGLVLDRAGLGPGGRIDPTLPRVLGTALAVVGVIVSVGTGGGSVVWLVIFPVIVGVGVAGQSMVNGLVRAAAHSALASTFMNFIVGTTLLVFFAIISVVATGWPTAWPTEPWYYLGGATGTIFIAIAAMLVRTAGVLLLSMSNVAGQLIAAVLFENATPLAGGLSTGMLIGSAVALLAVAVAALPSRTRGTQK